MSSSNMDIWLETLSQAILSQQPQRELLNLFRIFTEEIYSQAYSEFVHTLEVHCDSGATLEEVLALYIRDRHFGKILGLSS